MFTTLILPLALSAEIAAPITMPLPVMVGADARPITMPLPKAMASASAVERFWEVVHSTSGAIRVTVGDEPGHAAVIGVSVGGHVIGVGDTLDVESVGPGQAKITLVSTRPEVRTAPALTFPAFSGGGGLSGRNLTAPTTPLVSGNARVDPSRANSLNHWCPKCGSTGPKGMGWKSKTGYFGTLHQHTCEDCWEPFWH